MYNAKLSVESGIITINLLEKKDFNKMGAGYQIYGVKKLNEVKKYFIRDGIIYTHTENQK